MNKKKRNQLSLGGAAAREERMRAVVMEDQLNSTNTYNLIMGLTVAYGLLVNALICKFIGNTFAYIAPIPLMILYFVCCFAGCFIARASSTPVISFLGYELPTTDSIPSDVVSMLMLTHQYTSVAYATQTTFGVSTTPLSHSCTFGNTLRMILAAPLISALLIVLSL